MRKEDASMSNCKVIALTNQKGGVGKTTTAVNLGVSLVQQGKKVLLIDADAQANLTMALGYNRPDDIPITLSTVMQNIIDDKTLDVSQGIIHHSEGVDLLPSNIEMSGFEVRLINAMSRERVLKTYVNEVKKNYDYVLIDCMPSLGMITINALAAADSVIIPTQPHYLSAKGLELLLRSVSMVKRQINPKLRMEVNDGEIVSLIGANGAGKTTTLHAITGLVPIKSGSVIYDGHDMRKTDPSRIVTMGLAHVPEGRQVFTRMTVAENLAMGAYFRKDKKAIADDLERVYARFPRLKERAKQLAGTLSGGEQQMLAMGRAIMSAPKLIVMDEPSMGLSPVLVQEVFSIIGTMHELGITILLVEQNAKMALAIADRAYVLENGRITMSGSARDLLHDDKVRKAYLGA